MCTAISLISKNKQVLIGRTMDFSYELNPEVYIVPSNIDWNFYNYNLRNKYQFIGTGQNIGKLIFVDGMNEMGLGVMALYFQGYAYFDKPDEVHNKKNSVGSIDIVSYLLGNFSNIEEVIFALNDINIIGEEDSVTNSVAPLHWFVTDKSGKSITVEKTINGLQIFENKIGVLANSPNFEWHMKNLNNYMNIRPNQNKETFWGSVSLKPFGQGAGTFGLPGDYTSPSRFVKVAFQKSFVNLPEEEEKTINVCFNILKAVNIPKGIVITDKNTVDYTQYTVFMNLNTGEYFFNTYYNNQIIKASIGDIDCSEIISLGKLKRRVHFENIKRI